MLIVFHVLQNNKLCTIAANIWGTRFKFYGHAPCLPEILGSVTYKTSFLHLQPRQMTVTVTNNYNLRKATPSCDKRKSDKLLKPTIRKTKQQLRTKIDEEEDDETMIGLTTTSLFFSSSQRFVSFSSFIVEAEHRW